MDDAALRVKPSGLGALVRLRADRERQALRELLARRADEEAAAAARERSAAELERQEAIRTAREAQAYGALRTRGLLTAEALAAQQASIAAWTEAVAAAAARVDAAQAALEAARAATEDAHARYAARARATRKWTRISDLVTTARSRYAEALGEQGLEDDTLARAGGARSVLADGPPC